MKFNKLNELTDSREIINESDNNISKYILGIILVSICFFIVL